jgi:hypothetical protein
MGDSRGGLDCSSGDEGHLFIAAPTFAKTFRVNVDPNEQGFVDAVTTQMLSLTKSD